MIDTLPLLPDDNSELFDSRYRVVLVAAQRAKQIMRSGKQAETSKYAKETSMALEEVLRGDVPYFIGEDAREAIRDAKRSVGPEFDHSLLIEGDENAKEIQKQLSVYIDDTPKAAEPAEATETTKTTKSTK
ncbi:MAG: DNA-directed RNA polymerase subunit omega [Nitrospirales bacterium]